MSKLSSPWAGKWKREDDVRINCLNLPAVHIDHTVQRPPSMKVLYSSPDYNSGDPQQQVCLVTHLPVIPLITGRKVS